MTRLSEALVQGYMAHVRATLNPGSGEGLREAAEEFNREAAAGSSPTG